MKKIRHSKFKNTGFLFEILTRQITLEVLNGGEEKAKGIVKEFFSGKTELAKELRLYNLLINKCSFIGGKLIGAGGGGFFFNDYKQ